MLPDFPIEKIAPLSAKLTRFGVIVMDGVFREKM